MSEARHPSHPVGIGSVAIVDERRLIRLGLAELVREAVGCSVITAGSVGGVRARTPADRTLKALIIGLPPASDPATLIAEARRAGAPVICAVPADDRAVISEALAVKAEGYLVLEMADVDCVRAILAAVLRGERPVPSDLVGSTATVSGPLLTERCLAVLRHLADGLHDEEIAEFMDMSTNTVRKHVRSAEIRLQARTRTEAVAIAMRAGLLERR